MHRVLLRMYADQASMRASNMLAPVSSTVYYQLSVLKARGKRRCGDERCGDKAGRGWRGQRGNDCRGRQAVQRFGKFSIARGAAESGIVLLFRWGCFAAQRRTSGSCAKVNTRAGSAGKNRAGKCARRRAEGFRSTAGRHRWQPRHMLQDGKRLKDFGPAVDQLKLALQHHEVRLRDCDKVDVADLRTLVAAHLNLASCHMECEAADAALQHAATAANMSGQVLTANREASGDVPAGPAENDFAMLAVSFHKVAEAHEALKEWGKAIFAHTQAREVVHRSLGPTHPLTQSLARCRPHLSRPSTGNRQNEFLDVYAASIGRSTGCPLLRPNKGQKVLPSIPQGARGKPFVRTTEALGFELVGYQMNATCFPSWPPTNASNEEQEMSSWLSGMPWHELEDMKLHRCQSWPSIRSPWLTTFQ
eukprot:s1439_g6.t1